MSMTDPIADLFTRIRNGQAARKPEVSCAASKLKLSIATLLRDEGYINGFEVIQEGPQGVLKIQLKYGPTGQKVINSIKRESTPGRRVYKGVSELPRPVDGMGISIVTTPKGVLSDRKARELNVGGELLCTVA